MNTIPGAKLETNSQTLAARVDRLFDFSAGQVERLIANHPGLFPIYTQNGRWAHKGEGWTEWCGGFLAGMAWLIANRTGSADWRNRAIALSSQLEPRKLDRDVHDLGFIFLNSYRPWYQTTGDPAPGEVLITAGRTLALRFNERGRFLRSFLAPESLFIDIMMNVPIIFLAARASGDQSLFEIASAHCRTTERTLIREDGSTAHEGIFDLATGRFLRQSTQQGVAAESTWSRGLAWSLYGFCQVYAFTQDRADLEVSWRNADCFLRRLGADRIPPWDFDAPAGARHDDSSAGAIAASGLFELARATAAIDQARATRYEAAATELLSALLCDHYIAWNTPAWEGVLKHGIYHFHKRLGVDESVMWGDFFVLEAAAKLLQAQASPRSWPAQSHARD